MLLQIPTHDQRIGPRRGKVDNNRGPRGSFNGWLHAGGSHDVQSRITHAAHLQDEYPTATVPAAHRSGLDGGVHTRLLAGAMTGGQFDAERMTNDDCANSETEQNRDPEHAI